MLTLYQKIALYEGLIACIGKRVKNIPGSVFKYSILTVFLLTHGIPATVNSEPRP